MQPTPLSVIIEYRTYVFLAKNNPFDKVSAKTFRR